MSIQVKFEGEQVLKNLNNIATKSAESLSNVTYAMALNTEQVAKNMISSNRNTGALENSIKIGNSSTTNMAVSVLGAGSGAVNQLGEEYIKYFYYGTSGSWTVSYNTPLPALSVMAKYNGIVYDTNSGEPIYWHLNGQEAHPFLENALTSTINSNLSYAETLYRNYILRGIL